MNKRLLCVLVLCCALSAALCAWAAAEDSDFTIEDGVLTKYNGSGGDVVIPSSVTTIGDRAFYRCTDLTSVTIPNSVTSIGRSAFFRCASLTSVTIPDSVSSIGNSAFLSCASLTSITIGKNVNTIQTQAFSYCDSLTGINVAESNSTYSSLDGVLFNKDKTELIVCPGGKSGSYTIPNSVTSIGKLAFNGCDSLTSVTIPNSVTSIGDRAFWSCDSLMEIDVAEGNSAYSSLDGVLFNKDKTKLIAYLGGKSGSYAIPNSVTSIGSSAFEGCTSLTSVTIPNSVTSIESYAFSDCTSLTSITIPDSVASIEWGVFNWCDNLTEINVAEGNSNYSSLDGVLFNKDKTELIAYPGGKSGSYTIPNSVTSIGEGAFSGCTSLTGVTIPNSVTSIEWDAFQNCDSLTDVYYSGNETQWNAISISSDNDPLTSATIHYGGAGPDASAVAPGETLTAPAGAPCAVTLDFSGVEGLTAGTAVRIVYATYDSAGQMIMSGVREETIHDNLHVALTLPAQDAGTKCRIFLVSGDDNASPLARAMQVLFAA